VYQEHGIAAALVDVVHSQRVLLEVVRLECVAGELVEPLVWRAIEVHATIMTTRGGPP